MKRVIVRIRPVISVTRYDMDESTNYKMKSTEKVNTTIIGSMWGSELKVYGTAFDLLDSEGYIIFTGSTRDLHAADKSRQNFADDPDIVEFEYTPRRFAYV